MFLERRANLVNDEDDSSNTPLHLASSEGHVNVVELLLKHGADVDARYLNFCFRGDVYNLFISHN